MSKCAVVFYSKNDTSKRTVERIRKEAATRVDVYNLAKQQVDLNKYNKVIIGCGIYASNLPLRVVNFIKKNSGKLRPKKVIMFVHGLISDSDYMKIVKRNLAEFIGIFEKIFYLGGYIDITKQNFIVKQLLLFIAKQNNLDPYDANTLKDGRIKELIACIDSE